MSVSEANDGHADEDGPYARRKLQRNTNLWTYIVAAATQSYQTSTPQKRHYEESSPTAVHSVPSTPSKRSRDASAVPMLDAMAHSPQAPPMPSLHHQYSTRSRITDVGSA